jgi:hypothetical protein
MMVRVSGGTRHACRHGVVGAVALARHPPLDRNRSRKGAEGELATLWSSLYGRMSSVDMKVDGVGRNRSLQFRRSRVAVPTDGVRRRGCGGVSNPLRLILHGGELPPPLDAMACARNTIRLRERERVRPSAAAAAVRRMREKERESAGIVSNAQRQLFFFVDFRSMLEMQRAHAKKTEMQLGIRNCCGRS